MSTPPELPPFEHTSNPTLDVVTLVVGLPGILLTTVVALALLYGGGPWAVVEAALAYAVYLGVMGTLWAYQGGLR